MGMQPLTTQQIGLPFSDSASCKRWLDALPLTNVAQSQEQFARHLANMHAADIAPLERLKILELCKEPLQFIQTEAAKRYAGRPLPLDDKEAEAWSQTLALWREVHRNYEVCLSAYREGDLVIAPYAALITMRCLSCLASMMHDHYRVYRQPPGALWQALHGLYGFAEQHGFARIRVQDNFVQRDPDSSCIETYLRALLIQLANPYSLSVRQNGFVRRWLEKWSALVGISAQPLPPSQIPLLRVDLASTSGVAFAAEASSSPSMRYLDLEQLSRTLRQTINLLKQGQTPAQVGLGEDARQPGCENLLMLLYVQWCRAGTARSEERLVDEEPASVCFSLTAVHFHASGGRPFRQPGELTSRERRELDTFGYIARVPEDATVPEDAQIETWQILNHSASGFMCILRQPNGRARISHNQLIAVRRQASKQFHLGMVQWLKVEDNNELQCGVRLFPGTPQAVAVRPSNFNPVGNSRYERAIVLPEVPAPATPATIVLPAGWFQSGRFVEIFADRKQVVKLLNLLEKGSDFDRGTISMV
jgi:cyclic-di-GMP-binding protein